MGEFLDMCREEIQGIKNAWEEVKDSVVELGAIFKPGEQKEAAVMTDKTSERQDSSNIQHEQERFKSIPHVKKYIPRSSIVTERILTTEDRPESIPLEVWAEIPESLKRIISDANGYSQIGYTPPTEAAYKIPVLFLPLNSSEIKKTIYQELTNKNGIISIIPPLRGGTWYDAKTGGIKYASLVMGL